MRSMPRRRVGHASGGGPPLRAPSSGAKSAPVLVWVLVSPSRSAAPGSLPSLASSAQEPVSSAHAVEGPINSPGGPFLYDRQGRVVFFHGVNAVFKRAPYELYPAPGKPWNFSVADASLMARLGFN